MQKRDVKQVIVVRHDLSMRRGKAMAQCCHASMAFLLDNDDCDALDRMEIKLSADEQLWFATGTAKIVVRCDSLHELEQLVFKAKLAGIEVHKVTDAGRTEFHGVPTVTCAAFGPAESAELDKITGGLKLL